MHWAQQQSPKYEYKYPTQFLLIVLHPLVQGIFFPPILCASLTNIIFTCLRNLKQLETSGCMPSASKSTYVQIRMCTNESMLIQLLMYFCFYLLHNISAWAPLNSLEGIVPWGHGDNNSKPKPPGDSIQQMINPIVTQNV